MLLENRVSGGVPVYIISSCFETAADYLYISESNENWEKYFNREMIQPLVDFVRCSDYKFLEIIS